MAASLDSIVKGAAQTSIQEIKPDAGATPIQSPLTEKTNDATNNAPNSPSMVYLNLLILEASLRAQYLELRARKRHHTFFLMLLTAWIAFFGYQLFFKPREDGRGVGGSIYWALESSYKIALGAGVITAILVWAVGIWERGIRWPRRWLVISNRGLRAFNCKLVVIRRPWYAEMLSTIGFFLTYGLFSHTASSSYRHVDPSLLREVEKELQMSSDNHPTLVLPHDDEERGGHEEDLAGGGDYVKLLLLAKPFSATFRENWEIYRNEYWERENERRALLRKKVHEHEHKLAKEQFGWLWWLPGRQPRQTHHEPLRSHTHRHPAVERERKRRSSSVRRGSTSSSRSQTPIFEAMDEGGAAHLGHVARKPSTGAGPAGRERRKKATSISTSRGKRGGTESRSVTPEYTSPLARETNVDEGRVTRSRGKGDEKA